jgi:hypothetical protein
MELTTLNCSKCNTEQNVLNFHKSSKTKSGYQSWCKLCSKEWASTPKRKEQHRNRYHSNKDKHYYNYFYKRTYGITSEQYNEMLKDQNNVCKICFSSCLTKRRLAVDHCHETGKVRGLLCAKCNSLLGQAGDKIEILEKAIKYLKEYK